MKIADGRSEFYQWDHDQQLIVPAECTEVHFDNGTTKEAVACKVVEDNGEYRVDVPNILLQTAAELRAYGWSAERKCVICFANIWVEPREKPADYVYTQTHVMRIENEIAFQLQQLKDSGALTGPKGEKGDDGHTPVAGADYWTDKDKAEIVKEAKLGAVGDIDIALDGIIAIQNELIGGAEV